MLLEEEGLSCILENVECFLWKCILLKGCRVFTKFWFWFKVFLISVQCPLVFALKQQYYESNIFLFFFLVIEIKSTISFIMITSLPLIDSPLQPRITATSLLKLSGRASGLVTSVEYLRFPPLWRTCKHSLFSEYTCVNERKIIPLSMVVVVTCNRMNQKF